MAGVRIERMARGEQPVVQAEIVPETPTRTIINLLGQHPERIGPVVDTVVKLSELLPELEAGYHPIDVTPPDDADEG